MVTRDLLETGEDYSQPRACEQPAPEGLRPRPRKLIAIITPEGKIKRVPETAAGKVVHQVTAALGHVAVDKAMRGVDRVVQVDWSQAETDPESDALGEN